jgi:hypothetical protein
VLSRPAHQRVTRTVGLQNKRETLENMNNIHEKKRNVIFLYYLLLWLPPIILAIIAIYYSTDIYKYFFNTRTAPIKGIIESQDELQFYMNPESCLDVSDGETEYATFSNHNPINKDFRFLSNDPITLSLGFDNGTLLIEKFPIDSTKTISYSKTITDLWTLNLLAEEASIVPSSNASFRIYANICDTYFIINNSNVRKIPLSELEDSGTNIFFTYFFNNSDEEVQITIDNASDQDGIYKKVQITYLTQDHGSITVESQGRILNFSIPNGKSSSDPPNLTLYSLKAQGIRFINPSGYVNIGPEGIVPFQANDDEQSDLVLRNNFNNRVFLLPGAGESLVISGLANSIEYRNIELLHSRWQLLSPELQASIVAAGLAAIGYLVVLFSPRIYRKYAILVRGRFFPKNRSEISDKKIIVPNGYKVFKLSDGCMIAGKLIKKPNIFRQSYTISNVYLFDDDEWHKGPKNLVLHKRRIIYHFFKTEEN